MQKSSCGLEGFSRPIAIRRSSDKPRLSRSGPRCSSTSPALNRSWPAGTGVCVVNTTSPVNDRRCLFKGQAFVLHAGANGLQHRESAVSLIKVVNAGGNAHGFQSANAANPEQQFLADADASIAAVQAGG